MRSSRIAWVSLIAVLVTVTLLADVGPSAADESTTSTTSTEVPTTTAPTTVPPTEVPTTTVVPKPAPPTSAEVWAAIVAWVRATQPSLPPNSGAGRRIVYSNAQQRVWLVGESGVVEHTYLVSGRVGTPASGTYRIFSKSRYASSGAVRMEYMMRFARGRRLAIGFHSIPVRRNGSLLQTLDQLGTHRSHGCVRQRIDQARLAWDWAPVGTTVVVTP